VPSRNLLCFLIISSCVISSTNGEFVSCTGYYDTNFYGFVVSMRYNDPTCPLSYVGPTPAPASADQPTSSPAVCNDDCFGYGECQSSPSQGNRTLYISVAPDLYNSDVYGLTFQCFKMPCEYPPTPEPTAAPSAFPTSAPTITTTVAPPQGILAIIWSSIRAIISFVTLGLL